MRPSCGVIPESRADSSGVKRGSRKTLRDVPRKRRGAGPPERLPPSTSYGGLRRRAGRPEGHPPPTSYGGLARTRSFQRGQTPFSEEPPRRAADTARRRAAGGSSPSYLVRWTPATDHSALSFFVRENRNRRAQMNTNLVDLLSRRTAH